MTDYIDTDHLGRLEQVAPDQTIGVVQDATGIGDDVDITELGHFDPRRLIEALLVAQDEYGVDAVCTLSVVHHPADGVAPMLLAQKPDDAIGGVIVAGRRATNR